MSVDIAVIEEVPQFGRLVRQHRNRIGLTQRELADFSTISVRAIRDLEQGRARQPRHATVRLIADGLRLGPRARTVLETAANESRTSWALKAGYDAEPPAPPTAPRAIMGRDAVAALLEEELSSGAERLVTVVGLGGVGKTRLALEVAARLHARVRFPVLWFAFPGGDPERESTPEYRSPHGPDGLSALVRTCVEDVFGGMQTPPQPVPAVRGRDHDTGVLAELVGDRPALLVVDGVPAECEPRFDRFARLLQECPELRVMITAERPFAIPGERLLVLSPLAAPIPQDGQDPQALSRTPAVRLFLDEVRRIRPDYVPAPCDVSLVADICRRLDALPAAVRAAASWLVVYDLETLHRCLAGDPAGLLGHLAGAEGGFQVREALDRRVRGLSDADAALLAGLCETGGGFDLDDVVALTGLSLPDCGRALRRLLLSGLVSGDPGEGGGRSRFRVLNLVRAIKPQPAPHPAPVPNTPRLWPGALLGGSSPGLLAGC
jgi:transcriptional regulator with XRE-family HTH domain